MKKKETKTFLLQWYKDDDKVSLKDFREMIKKAPLVGNGSVFSWIVYDDKNINLGDKFFLIQNDGKDAGIVCSGQFESLPYEKEGLDGNRHVVFYEVLCSTYDAHLGNGKALIKMKELEMSFPRVVWDEIPSGMQIQPNVAKKLEKMWDLVTRKNLEF